MNEHDEPVQFRAVAIGLLLASLLWAGIAYGVYRWVSHV
jgi:hypothetical protein